MCSCGDFPFRLLFVNKTVISRNLLKSHQIPGAASDKAPGSRHRKPVAAFARMRALLIPAIDRKPVAAVARM
jgi:hypothetical protein